MNSPWDWDEKPLKFRSPTRTESVVWYFLSAREESRVAWRTLNCMWTEGLDHKSDFTFEARPDIKVEDFLTLYEKYLSGSESVHPEAVESILTRLRGDALSLLDI